MAAAAQLTSPVPLQLPGANPERAEARWYAAYTCANHEKRVAEQFAQRAVLHFLPLYASERRWKDRRVSLHMPLFPGYVFVHIALGERLRILQVSGVAHLVGFGGAPVALPENEIEALRAGLRGPLRAEPHRYLQAGQRVRVTRGPLAGTHGILVRHQGSLRVVLSLELIQRSIAVEVGVADVQPS